MARRGLESDLPLIGRQQKEWKKRVEFPRFPGYVFARYGLADAHDVPVTPAVATIMRVGAARQA